MSELRTSEAGLKLIMSHEGFRSVSKQLPDGRWVIGYGHLKAAREGLKISQTEAEAILREYDLPPIEKGLNDLLLVPVSQNEFDALSSFAFNIGLDQFEGSDVLAHINAGNKLKAAWAMESWRKARVGARDMVVDPLVRRRADEKALFLKTEGPVPLASSSRFRPLVDIEETERYRKQASKSSYQSLGHPANDQTDDESSTEAAARNVKERLTRILGEGQSAGDEDEALAGDLDSDLDDGTDDQDESVADIRKAVSALAVNASEEIEPQSTGAGEDGFLVMSADNDVGDTSEGTLPDTTDEEKEASEAAAEASVEEANDFSTDLEGDEAAAPEHLSALSDEPVNDDAETSEDDATLETPAEVETESADTSLETSTLVPETSDLELTEEGEDVRDERGRVIIDDLRPSDLWLSDGAEPAEEKKEGPMETMIFGLLALIGAGLFAYGGMREFGWFGMASTDQTDMTAYLPPFLMLLGGLVFIVMSYYCVKALFTKD